MPNLSTVMEEKVGRKLLGHRPLLEGRPLFVTESDPEEETPCPCWHQRVLKFLFYLLALGRSINMKFLDLEVPWAPAVLGDDVCKYLVLTELSDSAQFSFLTPSQVIK